MVAKNSGPGKKQVRKVFPVIVASTSLSIVHCVQVLVYLCGSKEKYRLVRDKHILKTYLTKIR